MTAKYYITKRMLKKRGACSMALAEFAEVFGERAEITPENVRKARRTDWLAEFKWPASRLYQLTPMASGIESEALGLLTQPIVANDDDAVVEYLNHVGAAWARFKRLKRLKADGR